MIPEDDIEGQKILYELRHYHSLSRDFMNQRLKLSYKGEVFWLEISALPLTAITNETTGWRCIGRNITEKKQLELQINRQAYFDEKSGLPNFFCLKKDLENYFGSYSPESGENGIIGLIKIVNIDQIRVDTDLDFVDKVILEFIKKFQEIFGVDSNIYRVEFNEFCFGFNRNRDDIVDLLKVFKQHMENPLYIDSELIYLKIHIGYVLYPDDGADWKDLFKSSEIALNSSSTFSGGMITRYTDEYSEKIKKMTELQREFPKSLERGDFYMVYQPQVRGKNYDVKGAEALARWNHPVYGIISPGLFIPLAEKSGFITILGEWIIYKTFEDAAGWPKELTVSVNISGIQTKNLERLEYVIEDAIKLSGLEPSRIILEFTESIIFEKLDDIKLFITRLQSRGIKVAIDDFGTGYSSLSFLQELSFNELKIDQSFVRKLKERSTDKFIHTIIELAKSLGLTIVAEGIEFETQAESLIENGCHILQGFYFDKPLVNSEFIKSLEHDLSGNN